MAPDIIPFDLSSHEQAVMDLSMRAWNPVFAGMKSAVPDYVYKAFYPVGWRARQSGDIEAFLRSEPERVWVAMEGGKVLGWVGIRLHPGDRMGEIFRVGDRGCAGPRPNALAGVGSRARREHRHLYAHRKSARSANPGGITAHGPRCCARLELRSSGCQTAKWRAR